MSTIRLSNHTTCGTPAVSRLLVGIPVLLVVMAACAWVFWAHLGFPPDLAPRHWWSLGIASLTVMVFWGGFLIAFGIGALWIFGVIAGAFGEGVFAAWRRLRHGKVPGTQNA